MTDASRIRKPGDDIVDDEESMECRLVENDPVRIYSPSGTLLREYPCFCEAAIPDPDRPLISRQVMIQYHESDIAFSKRDLLFAAEYQFSEARLIGRTCIFSLKPTGADWPDPDTLAKKYDEISASPGLAQTLERVRNSPEFQETSWDPEVDLLQVKNDLICKKIAGIFHLEYTRIPYTGCYLSPQIHHTAPR